MIKLYGIFGFPLGHTLSPLLQEAAFRALGIKALYLPLEMDRRNLLRVFRDLRNLLLEGFNVTVPYKETIVPYLDRLDVDSRTVGAVNTVKKVGRELVGYNTDVCGFLSALRECGRFKVEGKTALILGAGGAAKAVCYALAKARADKIIVANRHRLRAQSLRDRFQGKFHRTRFEAVPLDLNGLKRGLRESDLLVNATSVGLRKGDPPLIPSMILPKKNLLVFDLIYNPRETKLLKAAKRKGLRTLNGLAMLFYQAVQSFEIWTGRRAPYKVMWKALTQGE